MEEKEKVGPIFRDIRRYYCEFCGISRSKKSILASHLFSHHQALGMLWMTCHSYQNRSTRPSQRLIHMACCERPSRNGYPRQLGGKKRKVKDDQVKVLASTQGRLEIEKSDFKLRCNDSAAKLR